MGIKGNHDGVDTDLKATSDGELAVRSVVQSELEHYSAEGRSFVWPSLNTDIDIGDTRIFLRNTSDKFLVLKKAIFNPSNVDCLWHVGIGKSTTVLTGGTVIVGVNMNEDLSTKSFDYDARDDEEAVADAVIMFTVWTLDNAAGPSLTVDLEGIILGKNQFVQINQETESTSGQVTIFGIFLDELA